MSDIRFYIFCFYDPGLNPGDHSKSFWRVIHMGKPTANAVTYIAKEYGPIQFIVGEDDKTYNGTLISLEYENDQYYVTLNVNEEKKRIEIGKITVKRLVRECTNCVGEYYHYPYAIVSVFLKGAEMENDQ